MTETTKIEIKSRWNGVALFSHDVEDSTMAVTLAAALKAFANLRDANLCDADLRGADLRGADLRDADLRDADLRDTNLCGADLRDTNLCGANLCDSKLIGSRPFFQCGPIGSRSDYLHAFITDAGIKIRAGCFFGSRDEFEFKLDEGHGSNEHGQEYRAALVLIDKHAELWTSKAELEQAA